MYEDKKKKSSCRLSMSPTLKTKLRTHLYIPMMPILMTSPTRKRTNPYKRRRVKLRRSFSRLVEGGTAGVFCTYQSTNDHTTFVHFCMFAPNREGSIDSGDAWSTTPAPWRGRGGTLLLRVS